MGPPASTAAWTRRRSTVNRPGSIGRAGYEAAFPPCMSIYAHGQRAADQAHQPAAEERPRVIPGRVADVARPERGQCGADLMRAENEPVDHAYVRPPEERRAERHRRGNG